MLYEVITVEGLKMNISTQKPEILIHIDRDKAQRFGLSVITSYSIHYTKLYDEISTRLSASFIYTRGESIPPSIEKVLRNNFV